MAILYVRDDGSDTSPYDTWTKAATKLATALADGACVAGSTVYVCSDHKEDENATKTLASQGTIANPVYVISVDSDGDPEPPAADDYISMEDRGNGGDIETTGVGDDITCTGSMKCYGLTFDAGDKTAFPGSHLAHFVDCRFVSVDTLTLGGTEGLTEFIGCTLVLSSSIVATAEAASIFRDCTWVSAAPAGIFSLSACDNLRLFVEDCDLSTEATLVSNHTGERSQTIFRRCKLHADTLATPYSGTIDHPDTWILIESCAAGTDTDPVAGLNYFGGFYGKIEHDEAEYRTGGASQLPNNAQPYSWKMTCNTNTISRHAALKTPVIPRWKPAGSQTLTVYVAHDAVGDGDGGDLQDDECWLEISSPDETANPNTTAQGKFQTTLPATVLTAVADLTNEGSDEWQDTPTKYQKITATINPAEAGPMVVRVCLATGASSIVWVDPKLHLA